jgi:hypothetical protein
MKKLFLLIVIAMFSHSVLADDLAVLVFESYYPCIKIQEKFSEFDYNAYKEGLRNLTRDFTEENDNILVELNNIVSKYNVKNSREFYETFSEFHNAVCIAFSSGEFFRSLRERWNYTAHSDESDQ